MLQELGSLAQFQLMAQKQPAADTLSPAKKHILNHLGAEPMVADLLCTTLGVELSVLLAQLVELEIDRYIVSEAGGYSLVG